MANQLEQTQERADGLEERLIEFAVSIIRLSNKLPNTPSGKHIAGQILRSGTFLPRTMAKPEELKAGQISSTS